MPNYIFLIDLLQTFLFTIWFICITYLMIILLVPNCRYWYFNQHLTKTFDRIVSEMFFSRILFENNLLFNLLYIISLLFMI